MTKPTIVAPGGSYEKAMVASQYGADEVYIGVPFTSLRMRQNKVRDFEVLQKTIEGIHKNGSKALLTMNIFPRNTDIQIFESVVEKVADSGADAIIFSDLGTFKTIRKYFPDIPLHLSTQTSTLNYAAVQFWADLGVKRIVCARELHIDEIKEIKQKVPQMELEVFVHGAMCMSYSGRCLLGDYMSGRQANKGECSHACRFKYKVRFEEERRPGKLIELGENEDGSYLLSSKDLCTIHRLAEIAPYVDALKLEGRSKSEFYVGAMVKAYVEMRNALAEQRVASKELIDLVNQVPHRPYRDGFLLNQLQDFPEKEEEISTTQESAGPLFARNYFGLVTDETIEVEGKTYHAFIPKEVIKPGDTIDFLGGKTNGKIKILDIVSGGKKKIEKAHCNMTKVFIHTDQKLQGREVLYQNIK